MTSDDDKRRLPPPISRGWQLILDQAPSEEEREKAEAWRGVFYAGALWIWDVCSSLDQAEMREFIEVIEVEIAEYRAEMRQQRKVQ